MPGGYSKAYVRQMVWGISAPYTKQKIFTARGDRADRLLVPIMLSEAVRHGDLRTDDSVSFFPTRRFLAEYIGDLKDEVDRLMTFIALLERDVSILPLAPQEE